jgi:exo-1,4-beta-D-glucosaminidase
MRYRRFQASTRARIHAGKKPRPLAIAAFLLVSSLVLCPFAFADSSQPPNAKLFLRDGWELQSSCRISSSGRRISSRGFDTKGWHSTAVPSTILAALVADKTFPDPYIGQNLRSIPGMSYPVGENFSALAMPETSPFHCSWWYRTEFSLPKDYAGHVISLHLGGVNYHANIWINGRQVAGSKEIAGAYRTYEFDVTHLLQGDRVNVLAIETIAQNENDFGITWVDWNPAPPDKDMGLWREVYLQATGPVEIESPEVITHFSDGSLNQADLTVEAELRNGSRKRIHGILMGHVYGDISFQQAITLAPGETRNVRFNPAAFPQLRIKNPRLWWPKQMGEPYLHDLSVSFWVGNMESDVQSIRFGIRQITSELDGQGHLLFRVNGKRLLIRGGGWAPDMLLRESTDRLKAEFRYIRDLNLNTIRLEGKMESDAFYDLADEQGILIMGGWSCCDYWEQWADWKPGDVEIASASLRSQIMRMRGHPSMLAWLNGSDNPPPANVEAAYIKVLKELDWQNPYLSSASQKNAEATGPSGVKMLGPYDYVPPDYWLTGENNFGKADGFNTEASPGPAIPSLASLRKMFGGGNIPPDDPRWNYHAGSEGFKDLSHFEEAMTSIYGPSVSIDDYEQKAQAMAYDGERAMFEAYSQQKYTATGIIQWMLNNAWPSLIWHLYDYYLQPAGGYFGTKKACEALHVQYSRSDRSVEVVNSSYQNFATLTVRANLYDFDLREKFSGQSNVDLEPDGVVKALAIPEEAFRAGSPVYFLQLSMTDESGKPVSENFYWLSAKKSSYDWQKTTYRYTPVSSYEDLTALQHLPKAGPIDASAEIERTAPNPSVHVVLRNPGSYLAFQVRLEIHFGGEEAEILPVLWQDNYIELMPGESREVTAQFPSLNSFPLGTQLTVTGWNIDPVMITIGKPTRDAARHRGIR